MHPSGILPVVSSLNCVAGYRHTFKMYYKLLGNTKDDFPKGALMSVSNLPFETQVLMPPDGGKWITKNQ